MEKLAKELSTTPICEGEWAYSTSLPLPPCRWWLRTHSCRRGTQLPGGTWNLSADGTVWFPAEVPPAIEFYVPWWAWPLELIHRAVFGHAKLEKCCDGNPE